MVLYDLILDIAIFKHFLYKKKQNVFICTHKCLFILVFIIFMEHFIQGIFALFVMCFMGDPGKFPPLRNPVFSFRPLAKKCDSDHRKCLID